MPSTVRDPLCARRDLRGAIKLPAGEVVACAHAFVSGDPRPPGAKVVEEGVRQPDRLVLHEPLAQVDAADVVRVVSGLG